MAKNALIKLAVGLSFLCGGFFLFANSSYAEDNVDVDVYIDFYAPSNKLPKDGSVQIFNETNWIPGSRINKTIIFENLKNQKTSINLLVAKNTNNNCGLEERLELTVTKNSNIISGFPKTLKALYDIYPTSTFLGNIDPGPNKLESYEFQVEFKPGPDDNDYNYNDKSPHYGEVCDTKFNITFGFDPVTITGAGGPTSFPGPRGDGTLDLPIPAEFIKEKVIAPAIVPAITAVKTMAKEIAPLKLPLTLPRVGAWSVLILASIGLIWEIISFRNFKRRK